MQPMQPVQPEEYVPDKANFSRKRFTEEQLSMLESLAPTEPLSTHELVMLPYLRKFLRDNTNHSFKYYSHCERRKVLREGLRRLGMRQPPEWISEIGDCGEIGFGDDKEGASKAKTLYSLECAAVGLGFQSPLWRSTFGRDVGILLDGASIDTVVAAQCKQRDGAEEEYLVTDDES